MSHHVATCRDQDSGRITSIIRPPQSRKVFSEPAVFTYQVAGVVQHPALGDETQVPIFVKVLLRLVPTDEAPAMMATAIRPAIRPYSIAVTPSSSLRKRLMSAFILFLVPVFTFVGLLYVYIPAYLAGCPALFATSAVTTTRCTFFIDCPEGHGSPFDAS